MNVMMKMATGVLGLVFTGMLCGAANAGDWVLANYNANTQTFEPLRKPSVTSLAFNTFVIIPTGASGNISGATQDKWNDWIWTPDNAQDIPTTSELTVSFSASAATLSADAPTGLQYAAGGLGLYGEVSGITFGTVGGYAAYPNVGSNGQGLQQSSYAADSTSPSFGNLSADFDGQNYRFYANVYLTAGGAWQIQNEWDNADIPVSLDVPAMTLEMTNAVVVPE